VEFYCSSLSRRTMLAGLTASVCPIPALGQTPSSSPPFARGAIVPPNLGSRIEAQKKASAASDRLLRSDKDYSALLKLSHPLTFAPEKALPARFDWRDQDKVTPVRHQSVCGSCWVFASVAAFESAYLIAAQQTSKSLALHVSEQQVLDCGFVETGCGGGWHEVVCVYLQMIGQVDSNKYPYDEQQPQKGVCRSDFGIRPYYLSNWGYVSSSTAIAPDATIKQAIRTYGPLVTSVAATNAWDSYDRSRNQNWAVDFPQWIFSGTPTKDMKESDINHEVLIVGWDDRRGVWIVKNSWGPAWGDQGYINLRYGTNYIGFGASWLQAWSPKGSTTLLSRLSSLARQSELLNLYPPGQFK
jgi:cathepsin L